MMTAVAVNEQRAPDDAADPPGAVNATGGVDGRLARPRKGEITVGITVVATIAAIVAGPGAGTGQLALLIAAVAGFGMVLHIERGRPFLTNRLVFSAAAVVLAVAVAVPPRGSSDLWSYAMYGRTVVQHGASPYIHRPSDYPADPLLRWVAPGWRHARSVYGPVFVALAAGVAAVAGGSPLATRLGFQLLAAAAMFGAMLLLLLRRKDAGALACVGLNPVVAASIVNGGHNDALIGLVAIGGVIAIGRSRGALAGLLLGLGALVKIVAVIPMAGVTVWAWRRGNRRSAAAVAAVGGGVTIAGYAAVGGRRALDPLLAAGARVSRATAWQLGGVRGAQLTHPLLALAVLALLVGSVVLVRSGRADPSEATGAPLVAFLLAAPYVLPWYAGWVIPALAARWRSWLSRIGLAQGALLLVVYAGGPALRPGWLHHGMRWVAGVGLPTFEAVAVLALLSVMRRARPDGRSVTR